MFVRFSAIEFRGLVNIASKSLFMRSMQQECGTTFASAGIAQMGQRCTFAAFSPPSVPESSEVRFRSSRDADSTYSFAS
jgi:hypothetical protein